jgi:hypothetical protein
MTIEMTGVPEPLASDPPHVSQRDGVRKQDQASDTTVLITKAEVGPRHCGSTGCATEGPGCAAEPDLRGRAEGVTPKVASFPIPHGVSGPLANGSRDGATVSPFCGCVGGRTGAGDGRG